MNRFTRSMALICALALSPGVMASQVELRSFDTVEDMGRVLVSARQDMDTALFNITVRQHQMSKAEDARDDARSSYGPDSRDAAVTQARYEQIKQEALSDIMKQMSVMAPKFEEAERMNREKVKRLLQDRAHFERLVQGHLRGDSSPETMAVMVYLATAKLNRHAQELHGKVILGKLDHDLSQLRHTIDIVDGLVDFESTPMDIDSLWSQLNAGDDLGGDGGEWVDDLDRLLAEG